MDDELRHEFNNMYEVWREDNPDGDITDWIVQLPKWLYWSAGDDFDPNPKLWRAWLDFCNWFAVQSRLLVAEAAQKKKMAQILEDVDVIERAARLARSRVAP